LSLIIFSSFFGEDKLGTDARRCQYRLHNARKIFNAVFPRVSQSVVLEALVSLYFLQLFVVLHARCDLGRLIFPFSSFFSFTHSILASFYQDSDIYHFELSALFGFLAASLCFVFSVLFF